MKAREPGEIVCAGSMVLGYLRGKKWLLLVAIDAYTSEAACHVTVEQSPAMIVRQLERLAKELPYDVRRVLSDQCFDAYRVRPYFRTFSVLEQFLYQFCSSLDDLPNRLGTESIEAVLNRVVWSYNNEVQQPKLGGLTPVAFRKHFFEETRQSSQRGSHSLDGTRG